MNSYAKGFQDIRIIDVYVWVHVFASRNSKLAPKVDTSLSGLKKVPRVKPILFKNEVQ